ncbi:DUF2817 domain-containing protein [Paraburkholderia sp. Cy-641]|uniref:DUF2817 domain-containing protein n=1 Tax=Paraburkholderia sp. Cy-641 TaxID=2608337 RepID=UPI001422531F|nr:DUF2817 domain-containing protein [Paraburkholderia sp. Cy-641]
MNCRRGPSGHGEKLSVGRPDPIELARARSWWGIDVAAPFAADSVSAVVTGTISGLVYEACPHTETTVIALEFGTVALEEFVDALRGDHRLHLYPTSEMDFVAVKKQIRDAFYVDTDLWRGMVPAQFRSAVGQAMVRLK